MTNEQLRMQMLSGVITEGEYKAKLEENKKSTKKSLKENFVGIGAINNPFAKREKTGYETAFEHFLGEKYELKEEMEEVEEISLDEGVTDEIENYFDTLIKTQPEDALALIMDLIKNDGKNWSEWIDGIQADVVDTYGGDYEGDIRGYREEL
jgi:hypothetical protein